MSKSLAFRREHDFWEALRKAVASDDLAEATELVGAQMEAWQTQLQIEMDKLTHEGNRTIH